MVRPPDAEVDKLKQVAREIRNTTEESGYTVGVALDQNKAFTRTHGPASALERTLVLDAARRGASQAGLWIDEVSGGGLDIVAASESAIRRYRVKGVKVKADGSYKVIYGGGSTLLTSEPDALLPEEKWILGFIMSNDHTIHHLLAAEIVGWRGEGPVTLVFGHMISLGEDQPPRGFTSTEEDLLGFEDEDDGEAGDDHGA